MTAVLSRLARRRQAGSAPAVIAMIVIVVVAVALVLTSRAGEPETTAAAVVPEGFPVPESAQVVTPGAETAKLQIGGTTEAIEAYYRDALPRAGWTVVEGWEGTDPNGAPTTGLMVQRGDDEGLVSFTATPSGRVEVTVNIAQPEYRNTQSGMDSGP